MSVHAATPQKLHQNIPSIGIGPLQDAYGNPKGPAKQQPMLSADAVESNEYSLKSDFIPPRFVLYSPNKMFVSLSVRLVLARRKTLS